MGNQCLYCINMPDILFHSHHMMPSTGSLTGQRLWSHPNMGLGRWKPCEQVKNRKREVLSNSLSKRSVFLSQMGHGTWVAWPGLKHQETEWTLTIKLTTLKSLLKIQPVSWTVVMSCRRGNGLLVAKGMFFGQKHFHSVPWLNMQTSWWVSTQHHKTLKPASTSSD